MVFINRSWMELKPNENQYGNQEDFEDYYSRVKMKREYKHIPFEVFEQWIHPHHNNSYTLRNYSWIDYQNVEFELCEWSVEMLMRLNVIDEFEEDVYLLGSHKKLEQFSCNETDLRYWKEKGIWRTPPIVIEVDSFLLEKPDSSQLKGPFQLIEGHSRLGYLKSMKKIADAGNIKLAEKQKIYLMIKSTNAR